MAPLGLGIIGTGRIAQRHLQSLAQTDDGQAISVYDVIPERAEQTAATFGIPNVARSLDELLERRDVSAVIVATPPAMHAQPTLRALEAGKHVLCEKPFSRSGSTGDRHVPGRALVHRQGTRGGWRLTRHRGLRD